MYFDALTNTVYLDRFVFSSKTNSIIGGIHKDNLFLQKVHPEWENIEWYVFYMQSWNLSGNFLIRLHYKAVNFGIKKDGYDSIQAEIRLGYTSYYITEDSEAWIEQEIKDGMSDFYVSITNRTYQIVIDAYLEIDYLEVMPIFPPYNWTGYEYTLPAKISGDKYIDSKIKLYGSSDDPELLPLYTLDGTLPTISNTNLEHLVYYDSDKYSDIIKTQTTVINSDTIVNQSVLYMKSLFDRLSGFTPSYYASRIMLFSNTKLSSYNPINNSFIEDFKLGPIKLGWNSEDSLNNGWQFTSNGLKTPIIRDGSCSIFSTNWPADFSITSITVNYSILVSGSFSGNFRLRLMYSDGSSSYETYLDTTFGEHIFSLTNLDTSFPYNGYLGFSYDSYAYMGGDINQQITINAITFSPEYKKELGTAQLVNGTELFPNSIPSLDWRATGNWHSFLQPSYFSGDYTLKSPPVPTNKYTKFSLEFTCIDGSLEIDWLCLVKGYVLIWLDNIPFTSDKLYNYFLPFKKTIDVLSGSHTISIMAYKYSWHTEDDQFSSVYINSISYPTDNGIEVFNNNTKDNYSVSYESGDTAYYFSFTPTNSLNTWNWEAVSNVLNMPDIKAFGSTVIGTEVNTLSITIPLSKGQYVTAYGYTNYQPPAIVWYDFSQSPGIIEYYGYYHKLYIDCSWGGTQEQYDNYGIDGYRVINWGTYFSLRVPYNNLGASYYVSLPEDVPVPDTGTISFSIVADNVDFEGSHYFTKIILPTPTEEIMANISPINDIVIFPIQVEFSINNNLDILYTTDDTDPKISLTSKIYSGPFSLTEPKLIRYCIKVISTGIFLEGEFSKLYLDKELSNFVILYDTFMIGIDKYVKFYSVPWHIPIVIFQSDENGLVPTFYKDPIKLSQGLNSFAITTPIITTLQSYNKVESFLYSFDFFNTMLYSIENGLVSNDGTYRTLLYSIDYEISAFKPSIIPSVLPGVYYNNFTLTVRSNLENYTIDIMRNNWEQFSDLLIDKDCSISLRLLDITTGIYYTEVFNYEIKATDTDYINFSFITRLEHSLINYSTFIKQCLSSIDQKFSTYITSFNYYNLAEKSVKLLYSDYTKYILDNNIITLFSDEAMQKPFSFHFNLVIQPNEYLLIPDEYTTVYVNDSRFLTYSQDNNIIQFGSKLASNTNCTIVPDMALRLCVENYKQYSSSVKVWTNVPINNYLIVNSDFVELSNDNESYSNVLKLANNYLYIRCIKPNSLELNKSMLNIAIKIIAYEEYTNEL